MRRCKGKGGKGGGGNMRKGGVMDERWGGGERSKAEGRSKGTQKREGKSKSLTLSTIVYTHVRICVCACMCGVPASAVNGTHFS